MAPSADISVASANDKPVRHDYDDNVHAKYPYAAYLPVWNPNADHTSLDGYEYVDKGALADKAKPHLTAAVKALPGASITRLTPRVGSEITGLQLSQLTDAQKNELALLVAERGVVVFRDQDFKDIGLERQRAFAGYYGRLHVHPNEAQVAEYPELYSIYQGPDNGHRAKRSATRLSNTRFHSDVSFEHQPPAYTVLTMLHAPSTGGDTAFVSTVAALDRLSPPLRAFLSTLRAEHSGVRQALQAEREGHPVRRPPAVSQHPVVRVHPATGAEALFVNVSNTTRLVGLRDEESEALLGMLCRHLAAALDCQARVRWAPGTVVLWDNRNTVHTPIPDFETGEAAELDDNGEPVFRHAFRITVIGERPYGPDGLETVW